jgi:threonine/homoserine/homoserine lactone efflux protein
MYKIMRLLLIAMWLVLCCALFRFLGWLGVALLIALAYKYGRKQKPLSAHGTAPLVSTHLRRQMLPI